MSASTSVSPAWGRSAAPCGRWSDRPRRSIGVTERRMRTARRYRRCRPASPWHGDGPAVSEKRASDLPGSLASSVHTVQKGGQQMLSSLRISQIYAATSSSPPTMRRGAARSCASRVSTSPRNPPSRPMASTSGCAIPSAITSVSPRCARRRCRRAEPAFRLGWRGAVGSGAAVTVPRAIAVRVARIRCDVLSWQSS